MSYVVDPDRPHLGGNIAGGDPRTHYPALWAWLVQRYAVKTVFDVGCGEGQSVREFARLGCKVYALDGLPCNVNGLSDVATPIVCDLEQTGCPLPGVDLVWCCEVVEHVNEAHVGNLLDTITCGRVLAMTHAVPGQGGWHHVNCQPSSYWLSRIQARGLSLDRDATVESRRIGGDFWQATGLIFTRPSIAD